MVSVKNLVTIDENKASLYSVQFEKNMSFHDLCRSFTLLNLEDKKLDIHALFEMSYIHESDIPTDSFYSIKNKRSKDTYKDFVYPMAIRYISKENTYVIERPPFQFEVDFRLGTASSGSAKMHPVTMWAPWTVMVFNANSLAFGDFSGVKLYFNDGPINSLDDIVVPCFYPNSYGDARICFSGSLNDFNDVLDISLFDNGNIGYIYNYIFNNYMMGGWNTDLDAQMVSLLDNAVFANLGEQAHQDYPTVSLLRNPIRDINFYKSIFAKYPRSFTGKYKRYFENTFSFSRTNISKEKMFARNFIIYSMFTLEQKLSLISEMKKIRELYISRGSSVYHLPQKSISDIIDSFSEETKSKSNSNFSVKSLYRNKDINFDYKYKSYKVHIYLTHLSDQFVSSYGRHHVLDQIISLENFQKINKIILDNINNEDPQIAFIYNFEDHTFDVIVNYNAKSFITPIYESLIERSSSDPKINSRYFDTIRNQPLTPYLQNIYHFQEPSLT